MIKNLGICVGMSLCFLPVVSFATDKVVVKETLLSECERYSNPDENAVEVSLGRTGNGFMGSCFYPLEIITEKRLHLLVVNVDGSELFEKELVAKEYRQENFRFDQHVQGSNTSDHKIYFQRQCVLKVERYIARRKLIACQ